MHYIYRITNTLDQKVYIGVSVNPNYRWRQHQAYSKQHKSPQYIHHAIAKYGLDNFKFEIIDFGLNSWHTDCLEVNYIKMYDSMNTEKGYNIRLGGNISTHSKETKEKMSKSMFIQIATKGHPATGRMATEEQRELLRKIRLENPLDYTDELRQKMSEAHIGNTDSEETKVKKSISAKSGWDKRRRNSTPKIKSCYKCKRSDVEFHKGQGCCKGCRKEHKC
jgi:group I intron endonuclease